MTPEQFLQELIESALPSFTGKIYTGNGKDFQEFLDEDSSEKPCAFISYEGYDEIEILESGGDAYDAETYKIYIRTDDNVKPIIQTLRSDLMNMSSEFTDDNEEVKYVSMPSGKPFRDSGADAFEITVIIK